MRTVIQTKHPKALKPLNIVITEMEEALDNHQTRVVLEGDLGEQALRSLVDRFGLDKLGAYTQYQEQKDKRIASGDKTIDLVPEVLDKVTSELEGYAKRLKAVSNKAKVRCSQG